VKVIYTATQGKNMIKDNEARKEAKSLREIEREARTERNELNSKKDTMSKKQYKRKVSRILIKELRAQDKLEERTKTTKKRKIEKFNVLWTKVQQLTK